MSALIREPFEKVCTPAFERLAWELQTFHNFIDLGYVVGQPGGSILD